MANQVLLMEHLQQRPPVVTLGRNVRPGDNTRNAAYSYLDINNVTLWPNFDLANVLARYGAMLNTIRINQLSIQSPPDAFTSERSLYSKFTRYIERGVHHGLRSYFAFLAQNGQLGAWQTPVGLWEGSRARIIREFRPDAVICALHGPEGGVLARAPGDIKPSNKWRRNMQFDPIDRNRREFKQALSQVNWYMIQHGTRYGFLMTDLEFVAIRQVDLHGNLMLSQSVPWATSGTVAQPQMTVMLAFWYLAMLTSEDQELQARGD